MGTIRKTLMISAGVVAIMSAASAFATASIVAGSAQNEPAGQVMSRSLSECYADLMRDWDGKLTQHQGAIEGVASSRIPVGTRSAEDSNVVKVLGNR
jgi:hypothetical protein